MINYSDELGEEIRKRMEEKNIRYNIINFLKESYYDTVTSCTFAESFEKGKIPDAIRENVLLLVCQQLDLQTKKYFDIKRLEVHDIDERIEWVNKQIALYREENV